MVLDELENEEIGRRINNPEVPSVGSFYGLFDKEYLYHERSLYYMLQDSKAQKVIIKNLLDDDNSLNDLKITNLKSEKKIKGSRRIDLFFIAQFTDCSGNKQTIPFIIELKTNIDNHSGQLTDYFKYIFDEYNVEPKCFYITPDGRKPHAEKEEEKIVAKYKPLSYENVVKGLDSDDYVINDYLRTVKITSYDYKYLSYDQFKIYAEIFKKIKTTIDSDESISSIECIDNLRNLISIEDNPFNEDKPSIYLKLKVTNQGSALAIERRWEYKNGIYQSSLYYGILWEGTSFDKMKFNHLIKHWDECGRDLNCRIASENRIILKNGKSTRKINGGCWYVVQYLTSWVMPLWDNLRIIKGVSDVESWARWIIDDLGMISGNDGNVL